MVVDGGESGFNAETRCARREAIGSPERSEPEGPQGAARRKRRREVKVVITPAVGAPEHLPTTIYQLPTTNYHLPNYHLSNCHYEIGGMWLKISWGVRQRGGVFGISVL